MHTVCETHAFRAAAQAAGMDDDELEELVELLGTNPMAGDVMQGTGGCRKLRFAKKGMGKSKGYRTITLYSGERMPVFLLTVFGKGQKVNLSKAERNQLKKVVDQIVDAYAQKVTLVGEAK